MTDDDRALVERLLDFLHSDDVFAVDWKDIAAAAESIEALSEKLAEAEALLELQNQDIGRLREALERIAEDIWGEAYNVSQKRKYIARAALGDTK